MKYNLKTEKILDIPPGTPTPRKKTLFDPMFSFSFPSLYHSHLHISLSPLHFLNVSFYLTSSLALPKCSFFLFTLFQIFSFVNFFFFSFIKKTSLYFHFNFRSTPWLFWLSQVEEQHQVRQLSQVEEQHQPRQPHQLETCLKGLSTKFQVTLTL